MANLDTIERCDKFADLRNGIRRIASTIDEWAGIPMPLDDMALVVEPNYPKAAQLMGLGGGQKEPPSEAKIVNSFWSCRRRSEILIWEENGKREWGVVPGANHLDHDLATLGASVAWGIEQEAAALQLLGTMVRHHTFKHYLLTGMFLERSERSGVTYLFRRLKPTVALSLKGERTRILCALCLHPIAYYEGSWAGAMSPTDDVIAHLALMRGDEPMFWRRANQHAPYRPEAGL